MSLSRSAFELGWTMLATRFTAPKAAKEGYWAYLEPRLDDAGYRRACEHLFATCHRFPRPLDFVEDVPAALAVGWDDYRTWTCEECGDVGRSMGTPDFYVCVECVRQIGRQRLRELKKQGKPIRELGGALTVGYGVLREDRVGVVPLRPA
jgi:hypothetical protein